MATDPSSIADETPLIPDLYPARFGSLDALLRYLEAFHMRCQRMILGICWYYFVRNIEVIAATNLPSVQDIITKRRNLLFGHVLILDRLDRRPYSGSSCTVPGCGG